MGTPRHITSIIESQITSDGAGVTLRRSIGTHALPDLDPFLLLDNFGTDNPEDYIAGFPSHPHRGFETVTYMIKGLMRHRDNTGAEGLLKPGGVQWMTAGRGIVHSEMPEQTEGEMSGFQLWVNLPAARKMCRPRYQDIAPENIPVIERDGGTEIRVIAGNVGGVTGPVTEIDIDPTYVDIKLASGQTFDHRIAQRQTAFIYVFSGAVEVGGTTVGANSLGVFGGGDSISISTASGGRFILVAGEPIGEPIARYGPFVMNTKEEIHQAIDDYRNGRF